MPRPRSDKGRANARLDEARAALTAARAASRTVSPPELFAPAPTIWEAEAERDVAVAAVAGTWRGEATELLEAAVDDCARRLAVFTADDVKVALGSQGDGIDRRALGSVLLKRARAGQLRADGYAPSKFRHASPLRRWAVVDRGPA